MKQNGISNNNSSSNTLHNGAAQRSNYHHSSYGHQERRCDNCKYRVALNECQQFKCKDCGTYIICDYCYEEYMEKNEYDQAYQQYGQMSQSEKKKDLNNLLGQYQKLSCVYCSSRHSIADICVKNLKSFGFIPPKGTNKLQISTLSKEKIKKLENLRVIQKTLVYVIGIAPEIAQEEILKAPEYFGQYGDLTKVVVNTNNVYNATRGGPSYSAYLTFSHPRESAIAILSVDQHQLHDRVLRASFGTSKFCQFFMNGQKCTNKDCLYLHEIKCDLEAYTKEDMQNNKFIFQEQQKIAIKLSRALEFTLEEFRDYNRANNKNLPPENVKFEPFLPSPDTIYYKDFHFLDEPLINRKHVRDSKSTTKPDNTTSGSNTDQNETTSPSSQTIQKQTPSSNASSNTLLNGHQSSQSVDGQANKITPSSKNSSIQIKDMSNNNALANGPSSTIGQSQSVPAMASVSNFANVSSTTANQLNSNNNAKDQAKDDISPIAMTLSNQKDQHNQSDRNQSKSKNRGIQSSNQNKNTSNTNVNQNQQNEATTNTLKSQSKITNKKSAPIKEDQNQSNANDREERKQQPVITNQPSEEDEKTSSNSHKKPTASSQQQQQYNSNSTINNSISKNNSNTLTSSIKALQLDNQTDSSTPSAQLTQTPTPKIETPRETTNALTSSRKIFDLSAQNLKTKGDSHLDTIIQDNSTNAPTLTKQSSYQGNLIISSLDQLVLAQVNNKKSEVSTLSKTPPHHDNQLMMQISQLLSSPMLFSKKQQSRFQFAHSVDPIKTADDWDEIEVPAKIQDLIERNIRTLSNSLSNKGEVYQEVAFGIKDLREKWLTKQEKLLENDVGLLMQSSNLGDHQLRNRKNDGNDMSSLEDSNRMMKYKVKKVNGDMNIINNNTSGGADGKQQQTYNLTEHSQNIRVKINRQNSKENLIDNNSNSDNKNEKVQSSNQLNVHQDEQIQQQVDNSSSSATIEDGKSSSRASSLVQQKSSSSSYVNNQYNSNYNKQHMKGRRRKEEKRSDIHNNIGYNKVRKVNE